MRKKVDYITIFFLFIIYIYIIYINSIPKEITILKRRRNKFETFLGS